jgi:hypothetical protein
LSSAGGGRLDDGVEFEGSPVGAVDVAGEFDAPAVLVVGLADLEDAGGGGPQAEQAGGGVVDDDELQGRLGVAGDDGVVVAEQGP